MQIRLMESLSLKIQGPSSPAEADPISRRPVSNNAYNLELVSGRETSRLLADVDQRDLYNSVNPSKYVT